MSKILAAAERLFRMRLYNKGGRNSSGVITVYHRGSLGRRRLYRFINFKSMDNTEGVVLSFNYDPIRTAPLAFVYYLSGCCGYIISTDGLRIGSTFFSGNNPEKLDEVFTLGAQLTLKLLPVGFIIHNVELKPNSGSKLCRAASSYAIVLKKLDNKVLVKLPSN